MDVYTLTGIQLETFLVITKNMLELKMISKDQRSITVITVLAYILILSVSIREVQGGKKCPGRCIQNRTECKANGGKIVGYCTNELPCCDFPIPDTSSMKIGSCGAKISKLTTAIFRSPDYPDLSRGDLTCQFEFIFSPNATGLLVEFTHVIMDGIGFVKRSPCESDLFLFKGFLNWTPPAQGGNLTNYVAIIDLGSRLTKGMQSLKILAIMSSKKYRWSIKITQLLETNEKFVMASTMQSTAFLNPDDDVDDEKALLPPDIENVDSCDDDEIASFLSLHSHYLSTSRSKSDSLWSGENTDTDLDEESFIINGDLTEISMTPWQASLRSIVGPQLANNLSKYKLRNCTLKEGLHFCGGTVISDRHIISAAHCFYMGEGKARTWQNLEKIKIVLGDNHLCDENTDGVQEFKVDKVYYHYAYDEPVIMHDIVVIKTDRKIKFSDKVQSVKLAEEGMTYSHIEALASGWGYTNLTGRIYPAQLHSANDVFIGNKSECLNEQLKLFPEMGKYVGNSFSKYKDVFDSLLCSYVRNLRTPKIIGQGDGGGPLVLKVSNNCSTEHSNEEPTLIGVVSYTIFTRTHNYLPSYVDFYQSVSFYRKWINLAMRQH